MKLKPWLLAGLGLLVLTGGLAAYVFTRPAFGFLAGRSASQLTSRDRQELSREGVDVTVYTFRADWDRLLPEARSELLSEGFREEEESTP